MNRTGHEKLTNAMTAIGIVTSLIAISPAAIADWLDVVAEDIRVFNVRTGEAGTTVAAQAGDTLQIICTEWIGLTAGHDLWETKSVQRWEDRVMIDSQIIALFNPSIAPGTFLGKSTSGGGGFLGLGTHSKNGPDQIRNVYPPVTWIANGIGNHEASCVLNQPKQISDNSAANNVARGLIVVSAVAQAAEPGEQQIPPALPVFATVVEANPVPETTTTEQLAEVQSAQVRPGTDAVALPPAKTAAAAGRIVNAQPAEITAPPNPCRMDVTYYVPKPPVIESSSPSLQAGDQVQIQCSFEKRTRQLEWQQCDDGARNTMQSLKFSQESGSRYSGMMIIDDANVGIATSPADGASFDNTASWIFNEAGSHEVTCQVDNGLHAAGNDSPVYLEVGASVQVGGQNGSQEFRAFEPGTARRVTMTSRPAQTAPVARDGSIRLSGGDVAVSGNERVINPAANARPEGRSARQPGGNDMVNPSLNPQPEVPSSKRTGGNDMVNPSLNPQPEAPSSKRAGGNDMVNPSLNPQPEVPSRRLDRDGATVSPVPMPDPPSPNLENNAPENFTGAAGQGSNRAFDPQSQYTGVWQSQDAATVDNDMNNAGARSATVAQPVGQSTGRLTGPVAPGGSESTAMSTPWERSVMTCIPVPGKGSAVAGMPSYDIWAQNTSSSVIASGQTVYWRLYGATVPSSKFAGTSTDWTEDGTYDLQNTIAVGAKVKVASAYVRGNVSGCETWAQ